MTQPRAVFQTKRRPFSGLAVLELGDELGAYTGKLLADGGAQVTKIEPPGGSVVRSYGPFVDDRPDPNGSLYWAFYNTGKRSVELDLDTHVGRTALRALAAAADILIDGLGLGMLQSRGIRYEALRQDNRRLIYLAITPFGQEGPWAAFKSSDLIALSTGGMINDCGYDDHSVPPIRGGGNQAYNTVSHQAMLAVLTALLWRQRSGEGQFIDVSLHDACATTIEFSNLYWLYNQAIIQRQTCRHAAITPTNPPFLMCMDGRYAYGAIILHHQHVWQAVKEWLDSKGLLLDLADEAYDDPAFRRQNQALIHDRLESLAQMCTAEEFYHHAQHMGIVMGVIRFPEDVAEDPHLRTRQFWRELTWGGKTFRFPGPAWRFSGLEFAPSDPATVGQHNDEVAQELSRYIGADGRT